MKSKSKEVTRIGTIASQCNNGGTHVIVPHSWESNICSNFKSYLNSIAGSEKTEVVYGPSNVLDTEIQFFLMQEGRSIPAWSTRDHL